MPRRKRETVPQGGTAEALTGYGPIERASFTARSRRAGSGPDTPVMRIFRAHQRGTATSGLVRGRYSLAAGEP
jgi:hypothetical protein